MREKWKRRENTEEWSYQGSTWRKLLYGWDDRKFEEEYLNKLEKNWKRWKEDRQIDESEAFKKGGRENRRKKMKK